MTQDLLLPELTALPAKAFPKRIRDMWQMYGKLATDHVCKNCRFFERHSQGTTWFKCRKSRVSMSNATDWRANWNACGLYEEMDTKTT